MGGSKRKRGTKTVGNGRIQSKKGKGGPRTPLSVLTVAGLFVGAYAGIAQLSSDSRVAVLTLTLASLILWLIANRLPHDRLTTRLRPLLEHRIVTRMKPLMTASLATICLAVIAVIGYSGLTGGDKTVALTEASASTPGTTTVESEKEKGKEGDPAPETKTDETTTTTIGGTPPRTPPEDPKAKNPKDDTRPVDPDVPTTTTPTTNPPTPEGPVTPTEARNISLTTTCSRGKCGDREVRYSGTVKLLSGETAWMVHDDPSRPTTHLYPQSQLHIEANGSASGISYIGRETFIGPMSRKARLLVCPASTPSDILDSLRKHAEQSRIGDPSFGGDPYSMYYMCIDNLWSADIERTS